MKKHKHNFRAINENSAGYYGILIYCTICGDTFTYDEDWILIPLSKK